MDFRRLRRAPRDPAPTRGLDARARRACRESGPRCRGPASGWRCSAAGRRGSWPRRTRRCARRPVHGETDHFAASQFPAARTYDRVARDLAVRHHHRGRCARSSSRPRRSRRSPASPTAPSSEPRTTRSSSTSPTRSRWCRPSSRRRRLMLLRGSLGERLDGVIGAGEVRPRCSSAVRPRARGRRAVHLPRPGLGVRHRAGGRAEDARGRAAVDRGLSADGVPPRPDLDRRSRGARSGCSARRCPAWSTTSRSPARTSSTTTSTRSPISSAHNCWRSRMRRGKGLDPDRPRHLTRSVVLSRS